MKTLYKYKEKELLVVAGHFNKKEIIKLKSDGYIFRNPTVNKNGIRIQ